MTDYLTQLQNAGPYDINNAITKLLITESASVPTDLRDALVTAMQVASPVEEMVEVLKIIYKYKDTASADLLQIGMVSASMIQMHDWYALGSTNVALGIRGAFIRILKLPLADGFTYQLEANDPVLDPPVVPMPMLMGAPAIEAPSASEVQPSLPLQLPEASK